MPSGSNDGNNASKNAANTGSARRMSQPHSHACKPTTSFPPSMGGSDDGPNVEQANERDRYERGEQRRRAQHAERSKRERDELQHAEADRAADDDLLAWCRLLAERRKSIRTRRPITRLTYSMPTTNSGPVSNVGLLLTSSAAGTTHQTIADHVHSRLHLSGRWRTAAVPARRPSPDRELISGRCASRRSCLATTRRRPSGRS